MLLDYILGNTDRKIVKNNYVAGGCVSNCELHKGETHHIGPPTIVALDQGSSFYRDVGPERNPFATKRYFCKFRNSTASMMIKYKSNMYQIIAEQVPKVVVDVVDIQRIEWAQNRLNFLVEYLENCKKVFGNLSIAWN
eukprot:NODE_4333_length_1186_cov_37.578551_g3826_i0.p1 GENE.NODE_4333_length_1186_cov_37.578551_g3826_i0~~NODE_4333_length_1186_cov_37.578551_g3826_i0.p1  ORF type:complete len:138 (+),score=19.48 NODE_4333_length_1186_cov_37.578551_g3826_i0:660-1073(+)